MVAGEAWAIQVSREKRRQACRRGSGLLKWEGHGGSREPLPWPVGAAGVAAIITLPRFVCLFLFLGVSLSHVFLYTAWRPHCVRSFLLHVIHRGGSRKGGAPLDRFALSS